MKWILVLLITTAILLSGYAVYKAQRIEAQSKPRVRLIAAKAT